MRERGHEGRVAARGFGDGCAMTFNFQRNGRSACCGVMRPGEEGAAGELASLREDYLNQVQRDFLSRVA
jgi:hypothetical protein